MIWEFDSLHCYNIFKQLNNKLMFQILYNFITVIFFSIWSIILTIFTGKLPKISAYHWDRNSENNTSTDFCSDKYIKTNMCRNVSNECKQLIIEDFLSHLMKDEKFINPVHKAIFPIFDGKEIIGQTSVSTVIQKSLKDYTSFHYF